MFPPEKSLKNLILNILLSFPDQEHITVEKIRKQLKTNYSVSPSYQGINKILHFLKEQNITTRTNSYWRINQKWTNTITNTLEQFNNKEEVPVYTKELKSISFNTIGKAFDFIISNIESGALKNQGNNQFITHVKNIAFISLDKKQKDMLKKFTKKNECHILVEKNNFLNRLMGKYFKSIGANVYIGIPRSTPYTISIYGNTLYHTYSNLNFVTYINKSYEKIKNISNLKAIKMFTSMKDNPSFNIKFIFQTDKEIIEMTKDHLLKIAKRKKI